MPQINFKRFYEAFGLDLSTGTQLTGDCPFCDKDKFYVNPETGQYSCKHAACDASGNSWSFLKQLIDRSIDETTDEELEPLSKNRGISIPTLRWAKVCCSFIDGTVLLPAWAYTKDGKKSLLNVYHLDESGDKIKIMAAPAPCQHQLYLIDRLNKFHETVFVHEGHWDALAMVDTLAHLRQTDNGYRRLGKPSYPSKKCLSLLSTVGVVGLPGATTFKEQWLKHLHLKKKTCNLVFDNDDAGHNGQTRLIKMISEASFVPSLLQKAVWTEDDPNDYRDLANKLGFLKAFAVVKDRLEEVSTEEAEEFDYETVDAIPCPTFSALRKHYDEQLELTPAIESTLATMLATIISTSTEGGQLGLRVIGKPGSAKSTLAECMSYARDYVYPRSKFSGLVSGHDKQQKKSQQMADKMDGKCVIVKEADTFLQLPNRALVESEIRDALGDGVIRAEYRTGIEFEIHTLFTMILCGTRALRQMDSAILGSRFLDVVIHEDGTDYQSIVDRAIDSQFDTITKSMAVSHEETNGDVKKKKHIPMLAAPTLGFIQEKRNQLHTLKIKPLTKQQKDQVKAMGEFVAYCRARVDRTKEGICYKPEIELPTRISELLTRLAIFLSVVLSPQKPRDGTVTVSPKVFSILKKITRDTSYGFTFDIVKHLYKNEDGDTKEKIGHKLGIASTQVWRIIQDMKELGLIQSKLTSNPHGQGRKAHYLVLTPELRRLTKWIL